MPKRILFSTILVPVVLALTAHTSHAVAGPGSWTLLPNGPRAGAATYRHEDIAFVDASTGWVVNANGDVWRTVDGGDNWSLLTYTGTYNRCVGFATAQHGWIGLLHEGSAGETLLETQDGGVTWLPVLLPEPKPHGLCGMQVLNDSTVCAVGAFYGYPRFIRTNDGGATWAVTDMSSYCGALVDTWWITPQEGIAVGSDVTGANRRTIILRTTDAGATWNVVWLGTRLRELCWKISFVDENIGFVSIENLAQSGPTYFLKTIDGGLTWNELLFNPYYLNCQGIGFVSEYYGWIGGYNIGAYVTTDGGESWTWKNFGYNVNRIRFLSPYLGYACGRDVYKFVADPTGVGEEGPPLAKGQLTQNRPNPFSGSTVIHYAVETAGPVSLRVFDTQGRQVRELVAGNQPVGQFSASFDATGLAAGTYFYQLSTPAGSETRKMQITR